MKLPKGMRRHIRQQKAKIRKEVFDQQEILKRFQALYGGLLKPVPQSAQQPEKPRESAARLKGEDGKVKTIDKITNSGIKNDSIKE